MVVQKHLSCTHHSDVQDHQVTIVAEKLPDGIEEAGDDLIKEIIGCMDCGRAYRILPRELSFYRRFRIPLPRYCHRCRYARRLKLRNPRKLYKRTCACVGNQSVEGRYTNTPAVHPSHAPREKCPNVFQTSYSPERAEIVYCESCYNTEVV